MAFASVVVEATDSPNKTFAVDASAVASWWQPAVVFGVRYAEERLLFAEPKAAKHVTVLKVETTHVDSNQMAVVFAAYQAACIAFGLPPDERVHLRDDWTYEFPTWRSAE
jgi:hypothetical protein